jgi:hypothetical protein
MRRALVGCVVLATAVGLPEVNAIGAWQSDLDTFMKQVLERRDDNWKKLQQYILDEREQIEVRGPARALLWGQKRDYTWYIRDGYFVRSPVRFNGVTIDEVDRRRSEADYLRRVKERDERSAARRGEQQSEEPPTDVAGFIRQSRQPEFISSAYFMRFRFDEGTYALAGREQLDGHDVLRIEYYPNNLFRPPNGRDAEDDQKRRDGTDEALRRLMNKVALVTLWIEPASHQIVKATYDNVTWDFLPAQWLVRVDDIEASMTMGEMFPGVWLPRDLDVKAALTFAFGPVDFRYALDYLDYRQADATIRIR